MANILGINTCHDPSIALCVDGKITEYYEETRFKKQKHWEPERDSNFVYECLDKIGIIDSVAYSLYTTPNQWMVGLFQTKLNNPPYYANPKHHHIYHAICGTYFSTFDDAMCIVIDGGGSLFNQDYETESIYYVNKREKIIDCQYVHFSEGWKQCVRDQDYYAVYSTLNDRLNAIKSHKKMTFSDVPGPGMFFAGLSHKYLKDWNGAGKLMGLASYTELDGFVEAIDLGKKAQQYLLDTTTCLIERATSHAQTNNIVLSGGCALNCVNNFKLVKAFPHLNFFIDPVPGDGGQSIGAAIYYHDYHK